MAPTTSDHLSARKSHARYQKVRKFLRQLAFKFRLRHPELDEQEVLSAVDYGFVMADRTFDGRTKFVTWAGYNAKNQLKTLIRNRMVRDRRARFVQVDQQVLDGVQSKPRCEFVLAEWHASLSLDGQELVDLVFDTPAEVRRTMKVLGIESSGNFRQACRLYLMSFGWDFGRVAEAFEEVRKAL